MNDEDGLLKLIANQPTVRSGKAFVQNAGVAVQHTRRLLTEGATAQTIIPEHQNL